MSTTSDFLGDDAAPRELTHGGKTYRFGRLNDARMEAYSAWLEKWVRDKLVRLYELDQATLAAKLVDLERDVLAGVYEFEGELIAGREVWKEEERGGVRGEARAVEGGVIHTHRGRVTLVSVVCDCPREEALALILARPAEVGHLLKLTIAESFPQPAQDDWRPLGNGQRPAANAPPA